MPKKRWSFKLWIPFTPYSLKITIPRKVKKTRVRVGTEEREITIPLGPGEKPQPGERVFYESPFGITRAEKEEMGIAGFLQTTAIIGIGVIGVALILKLLRGEGEKK